MRQDLGQPAAQPLRRLFLAARNYLRLRFSPTAHFARPVSLARAEHVALSRTAAATGGGPTLPPRWAYPRGFAAAVGRQSPYPSAFPLALFRVPAPLSARTDRGGGR